MWKPWPGAQEEFCSRGEFEVLYGGAAGPGKTDCLIALATRWIEYPDYSAILFRRTYPQLQEIIDRCWKRYPSFGGVYRSTEHRWYFPSGSTIALSHMQHEDDKYNHQGKEYHFIGFDELTQFSETQYTYLFSRARTTDSRIPPRIRASTNPGGIGHIWVKDRFVTITDRGNVYVDPKTGLSRVFIPGTIEDNPTLTENDPGYVQRLEALPEIEKQRLRYGIWDAFEGQVFTELSKRLHGCDPFDIPPEWERICVMDWGFARPFSVGWYALDYDDVLWRYREWYGCKEPNVGLKMPAYEVARGILDREKGEKIKYRVADPSIWHPRPENRKGESRGPTIQEDMSNEGVFFMRADNDRIQGKMQVHKRLRVEEEIDEKTGEVMGEHAMLRVFNNHEHFWRTMPVLQEDPNNPEDVETDDQEDDIYDELRYMCMARPVRPKKVERIPSGSFMAERNKYIRAKQYAQRHGVSMTTAYSRVR